MIGSYQAPLSLADDGGVRCYWKGGVRPIEGADYDCAFQITIGRPGNQEHVLTQNGVVLASGSTYAEFTAAFQALGYQDIIAGSDEAPTTIESHYICPCPPGVLVLTVDGKVQDYGGNTPISEIPNWPENLDKAPEECTAIIHEGAKLRWVDQKTFKPLTEEECETLFTKPSAKDEFLNCLSQSFREDCPKLQVGPLLATQTTDQYAQGDQIMVPLKSPQDVVTDWAVAISLYGTDECIAKMMAEDPNQPIPVYALTKCHDLTLPNGTTGFNLFLSDASGSPVGSFVQANAVNTFDNSGNVGGNIAGVGVSGSASASNPALDKADRLLEFNVPLWSLVATPGNPQFVSLASSAFGAVISVCESMAAFCVSIDETPLQESCDCGCI